MRPLIPFGAIFLAVANSAHAAHKPRPAPQLPRIVGGPELRQLIGGSSIWEIRSRGFDDQMSEFFRRDRSYTQNDGANEGDVGRYYFSGNTFCIKYNYQKPDRCRSVLIDSRKRTWLIIEDGKLDARLVQINPINPQPHAPAPSAASAVRPD